MQEKKDEDEEEEEEEIKTQNSSRFLSQADEKWF